jgi:hypothetical protein
LFSSRAIIINLFLKCPSSEVNPVHHLLSSNADTDNQKVKLNYSHPWSTEVNDMQAVQFPTMALHVQGCLSLAWKDYSRLLSNLTNFWLICISLFDRFVLNEPFIDNTGPSLGSLTVYTKNAKSVMTPVWRLYNHRGPEWRYAQAPIPETTEHMVQFIINPALRKGQASINK